MTSAACISLGWSGWIRAEPDLDESAGFVLANGMSEPTPAPRRGRPPHPDGALTGAARQRIFARKRKRDTAELAYALKDVLLRTKANQKAFSDSYRGLPSGERLRRVLVSLLADDPEQFAQKALWLFENPEKAAEMAARARREVVTNWDMGVLTRRLELSYREVLRDKRANGA